MEDIVIVGAARTAIGKFGGSLASIPAAKLGAHIIRKVLERSGVAPEQVSEVIMGQVLAAGAGRPPARPAALLRPVEARAGPVAAGRCRRASSASAVRHRTPGTR